MTLGLLPTGVESEQLARQLAQALACAALQVLPGLTSELRKCWSVAIGADVSGDLANLLVWNVKAVLAAEGEQQVVARDPGHLLRLERLQATDAVVLVNNVVARPEIGEALERSAQSRIRSRRTLAEDLRVREQDKPVLPPDEASPGGRDREEQLGLIGQGLAGLEQAGIDPPEQVLRPQRLPPVRERHDHALAGAYEGAELVLSLCQPSRGQRRTLRLEREGLVRGQRIELGRPLEVRLDVQLLHRDLPHLVGLPHEIRTAVERRHEIAGDGCWTLELVVRQRWLRQVRTSLGRRVDDRALDRVQRALRKRGEGPDRLDLVAEQLDAERLPARGRKEVDKAAADSELAALLDPLDTLVARQREALGEQLDPRLLPLGHLDRLGPLARRWHSLGECGRRGAHEPALREHVQRARPLADEVRRRLETRPPVDAPAGQQSHPLLAEKPGSGLGRVPRVGVLGKRADETARRSAGRAKRARLFVGTASGV